MTFTSIIYFCFLPAVWLLYQVTADRYRWLLLLAASYGFYASLKVPYLPAVLLLITVVTYLTGRALGAVVEPVKRRLIFRGGIGGNLLVLLLLKYLPFLSGNLNGLANRLGFGSVAPEFRPLVAIGVSYFVFQAISYLADIYLEIDEPERHPGRFALYLAFFPKLLQGPIERGSDLLPQLREPFRFDYDQARLGVVMFTWGLFKKVVIADRLALFVDPVYGNVHAWSGLPLLLATYAYAFQLYFDFSGYTDMALGSARLFNIRLTQNFNSPYLATSVADFWRRWHISFSRWILDYIFKPLQMQWRGWGTLGTAVALLVAFLVSGIWHGASWGFVVWGGLHGIYLALSVYWKPYQKKLHRRLGVTKSRLLTVWQVVVTFHLVCVAWIFFRVESLDDANYILFHFFNRGKFQGRDAYPFVQVKAFFMQSPRDACVAIVCLVLMALVGNHRHRSGRDLLNTLAGRPLFLRWVMYFTLVAGIITMGVFDQGNFIYFKF